MTDQVLEQKLRLQTAMENLKQFLTSPNGEGVIELIAVANNVNELIGKEPTDTYYRLGKYQVVKYLESLRDQSNG